MRVLVCGGRDYDDWTTLRKTLVAFRADHGITLLIHGAHHSGADRMAGAWAAQRGVPCATVPAHWNTLGRKAGPLRNQWMATLLSPDVVLAFPGGTGTADMVSRAEAAGIKVIRVGATPPAAECGRRP